MKRLKSTHIPAMKQLKQQVSLLAKKHRPPFLSILQIGNHPASNLFIKHKKNRCHEVGIDCALTKLEENVTETTLINLITRQNNDPKIDGILLQLPLPQHLDALKITQHLNPKKDVDGFHPQSVGLLSCNQAVLPTCVAQGIMLLLADHKIKLPGMECVVIGASPFVGRPIAMSLVNAEATVTTCHASTKDLAKHIQQAELVVSAIGKPGILDPTWFNEKHLIIDVGIHLNHDQKVCGDLDANNLPKCAAITPVPGGIGPMTVLALLQNTLTAATMNASP
jgi:methylenetetrahydrofolate dehydrogenase (NADP+) / methenyltetrahydrofolate cyclohydrolase